jgi:hypothetical protein
MLVIAVRLLGWQDNNFFIFGADWPMNFEPAPSELNFDPFFYRAPADVVASFVAEASIVRTIVQGSGGPENAEITEMGLRFVRHLMSTSRAVRFGFVPNFKDMDAIRECARDFIRKCGGAATALQTMYAIIACD